MRKNQRIIAVRKDNQGRVVEVKTDIGKIYNYEMAKEAIDLSLITDASCYPSSDGSRKIRLKDQDLDSLPEF